MKILLISSVFYPKKGGVEKVVETIAKNFKEAGHNVSVLTSLYIDQSKLSKFEKIKASLRIVREAFVIHGYNVYTSWMGVPKSVLGYFLFLLKAPISFLYILTTIKKIKPDIINLHFPDASSIYVYFLLLFYKKPLVINIHGNDLHVFSKIYPYKFFIPKLIKKASKIIVNSKYMSDELTKEYVGIEEKTVIIENGIYLKEFYDVKPVKYFKEPYFFYVGRFVHKKGVDVLIKAFKKSGLNKNAKLLIEGKGEKLNEVMELRKKLSLTDKVVFTKGTLTDKEKVAFMKGSICMVMPSRIEPFGIVAIEGMASGVPLIVSKTGGLKNLVTDGVTGLFFKNRSVDDLALKMKKMFKDKKLREELSKNGIKESKKYSWDKISGKYLDVYKDVKK